jgi:hypothetical protein
LTIFNARCIEGSVQWEERGVKIGINQSIYDVTSWTPSQEEHKQHFHFSLVHFDAPNQGKRHLPAREYEWID